MSEIVTENTDVNGERVIIIRLPYVYAPDAFRDHLRTFLEGKQEYFERYGYWPTKIAAIKAIRAKHGLPLKAAKAVYDACGGIAGYE